MKLNKYQTVGKSMSIYPGKLVYPALGLCGEAAELTDACRQGTENEPVSKETIMKEIGDVLWYAANVAADADLKLSDVCEQEKFNLKAFPSWDWNEACEELVVECGVVAENVKKTVRDTDGVLSAERRENIRKALKKVIAALVAVAVNNDSTLKKCAKMNLDKLRSRQERGKLQGDGDDR